MNISKLKDILLIVAPLVTLYICILRPLFIKLHRLYKEWKSRTRHLATPRRIGKVTLADLSKLFSIEPATIEDLKWIAELEKRTYIYPPTDAVPYDKLREWYNANPSGFFVIKHNNLKVGHIDILPLKPEALATFIHGVSTHEQCIISDDIYTPADKHLIRDLYIESIIVDTTVRLRAAAMVKLLLADSIRHMVENICPLNNVAHIYAIAATIAGNNLMPRLQFTIRQPLHVRSDRHNMWWVTLETLMQNGRIDILSKIMTNTYESFKGERPTSL
jgi:hypothetical protein